MLTKEKQELFTSIIQKSRAVDIILHDHPTPDPDALGSSQGLEKLIKDVFDKPVRTYGVPPDQTQNKLMLSELGITLYDPRKWTPTEGHMCILVDCNERSGSLQLWDHSILPAGFVTWTIDHHCDKDHPCGETVDLQPVGANCTIITEYLQQFKVEFSPESHYDMDVATGLMLGLMTDTDNLTKESVDDARDVPAFLYLKQHYNPYLYNKLKSYDFPSYFYDYFRASDTSKIISEPFGIYNLGFLKEERAGVISQIADLWMRRERLHIVVVVGVVGKELRASVRTKNGGGRASEVARLLFPDCGAGGGENSAGASMRFDTFIDIDMLDEDSRQEFLHITTQMLVARAKKITDLDE